MIAVVTGGSGFLGHNLVRRLLHDGHEVRCLVRPLGGEAPRGARRFVVRYDQPRSLLETPALDGADVVFHLAGVTRARSPAAFIAGNVTPTRHLLGAILARRLYPRFVFVSSQAAAGPAEGRHRPVDESDPPRPVEAYGSSKLEAERIVESFADRVPTTIVRPCAVFGPFDRDFLLLFRMARRGVLLYPAVAEHWLSLLYVDDVIAGLLACATRPQAIARTYFVASAEPVQWRALGEHIAAVQDRRVRHLNLNASVVRLASLAGEWVSRLTKTSSLANRQKAALSRHPFWVCSGARAQRELGWNESFSLPDAVQRTYFWYRKHGWLRASRSADTVVA